MHGTPTAGQVAAARDGQFTAEFPNGRRAAKFFERITGTPGFWVRDVRRNRAGGRIVYFTRDRDVPADGGTPGWAAYWLSMSETVGHYGSSFGEPPHGAGRKTATLNGRPCPASM